MLHSLGKIPENLLSSIILRQLGKLRMDVILGPKVGEDAALIRVGHEILAASSDPITASTRRAGWLAVHANANDIATRGIRPSWFLSTILLPPTSTIPTLRALSRDIHSACEKLGVALIGGHTEFAPGITHPIIVGCMLGLALRGRYVTCGGAKVGDALIQAGSVGIEGTAILAEVHQRKIQASLGEHFVKSALNYYKHISVVEAALSAVEAARVHAMHDPTEGGIAGGLHELADASTLGFLIREEDILVKDETRTLCTMFRLNPYQLISSGCLLIACAPDDAPLILNVHRKHGITSTAIGYLTKKVNLRQVIDQKGIKKSFPRPVRDEIWKAI